MQPITDRTKMFVLMVLASVMMTACSTYTAQRIDRDVSHWHPYEFRIHGSIYQVKIPPDGMIITKPMTDVTTSDIDDYMIAASFGYDYGRGTYDDIAQFKVDIGISKINGGISCHTGKFRFGECILKDSDDSINGHVNQYKSLGALQWFHESDIQRPWDAYSIMLDRDHYLSIVGFYWRDLAARPDMLTDRRRLLEEIVSTVDIIN